VPKPWREIRSQCPAEVAEWLDGFVGASQEMIDAQAEYIAQLEMKLLEHGDLEVVRREI
jgi:hypothetical protein